MKDLYKRPPWQDLFASSLNKSNAAPHDCNTRFTVEMRMDMPQDPFYAEISKAAPHHRDTGFVQGCAVEMDMPQEPYVVEI